MPVQFPSVTQLSFHPNGYRQKKKKRRQRVKVPQRCVFGGDESVTRTRLAYY